MKRNPRAAVVEYLQCELLDSLFKNREAAALSFIGGTAIRILHNSQRFSEDLDFDNFELTFSGFEALLGKACRDMEFKGFLVETRFVEKGAYHCYIRFPEMLQKTGLAVVKDQKILIRIDAEKKLRNYTPSPYVLNRFALYRRIQAAPAAILLSQKLLTVLERKREKGRDLFDVSFLMGMTEPDFGYLEAMARLDRDSFRKALAERLATLDLASLARDVEPFLFDPGQKERVLEIGGRLIKGNNENEVDPVSPRKGNDNS